MGAGLRWEAGAFAQYLRTGRIAVRNPVEVKFNPYHDPRDGRFTFAPGGGTLPARRYSGSRSQSVHFDGRRGEADKTKPRPITSTTATARLENAVFRPGTTAPKLKTANFRQNPRARRGGNSGQFYDPMTLDRVFPGLQTLPGGSIIALGDSILDVTGPRQRLSADLSLAYTQRLIRQITIINPAYRFDSLGFPPTLEGQMRQINGLRIDRATAFFKIKNELRPLQTETLRFLQAKTDAAYAEGVALFQAGRLRTRLSREEAIGNYVDRQVRRELRDLFNRQGISVLPGSPVRVNNRAPSLTDGTCTVPDSRVGDIAFDVTLTRKTDRTPQVGGFFRSHFQPRAVVIVRPTALGSGSTYVIKRR